MFFGRSSFQGGIYNLEIFFEIKPICRRIIKFIFWYRKQHSPHLNCLFIYPFNLHMRSICHFLFGISSPEMKDHQLLFSNLNLFFKIGKCAFQCSWLTGLCDLEYHHLVLLSRDRYRNRHRVLC